MENAATMSTLLHEIELVLQGLLDAGYNEQFERVIYNASSDFHINFPDDKEYFALFVENGMLKYFAFDNEDEAERKRQNIAKDKKKSSISFSLQNEAYPRRFWA